MRSKKEYRTDSRDNYDRFMKNNSLSAKDLTYKKYSEILNTCNWLYIEYALSTGEKVKLPCGFGKIAVSKKMLTRFKEYNGKRYINLRVDWVKTKKVGKLVYHNNEHTDGYNFKWAWFPRETKLHLSELFVFKPCRYASRAIARYINEAGSNYKEVYLEWFNTY